MVIASSYELWEWREFDGGHEIYSSSKDEEKLNLIVDNMNNYGDKLLSFD